jgi:hypothetical protein
MNIHEFCRDFRISLKKARRIEEAGLLRLDAVESEYGEKIRQQLSKGQPLTTIHFVAICEEPSILVELGRYGKRAEKQLEALGNVRQEAAPVEIVALISDAAKGYKQAIVPMVAWMKQVIPIDPVRHHWIATRLLLGVPAKSRRFDVDRIIPALGHCRKHPDLAGWWRIETIKGRNATIYQRPETPYDL